MGTKDENHDDLYEAVVKALEHHFGISGDRISTFVITAVADLHTARPRIAVVASGDNTAESVTAILMSAINRVRHSGPEYPGNSINITLN